MQGEGGSGALSAHAKSLHKGLDLLQGEFFHIYMKNFWFTFLLVLSYFLHKNRVLCMDCNRNGDKPLSILLSGLFIIYE